MSKSLQSEWLEHEHTEMIIHSAEKRRETCLQTLLGCTAKSSDPMVREMWGRFAQADEFLRFLKRGE